MVMMRLSRTCYDRPHRCPGWAGGGWKTARTDRCDNGSIRTKNDGYPGEHRWRFGHCTECNTVTWPVVTRWLDPGWLRWVWWERPRLRAPEGQALAA